MRIPASTRLLTAVSVLGCITLLGQTGPQRPLRAKPSAGTPVLSVLPATPPTAPSQPPPAPAQRSPQHAVIRYSQGLLSVNADNSSLNQILREVGRLTGMKISGGVSDERVYGFYGPAPVPEVLATLLDGTGSNMLLLQSSTDAPAELVLTTRHGGPTPPNPNAQAFDDGSERNAPPPQQLGGRQSLQAPPASSPPPVQPQQDSRIQDTLPQPQSQPAATDSQQDPANGTKTPQQIYEQLLKMQQQQQSPR